MSRTRRETASGLADAPGDRLHVTDDTALVEDGLLTVAEAAAFLRLSRSTIYTLMDQGELRFVKIGRSRRVPRRAVVELALSGLQGGVRASF